MEPIVSTTTERKFNLRIKPVVILIVLVFLLVFNGVAVLSYEHGWEKLHFNVVFYMYFYFWITFFLIAVQVRRIMRGNGTE